MNTDKGILKRVPARGTPTDLEVELKHHLQGNLNKKDDIIEIIT
jgi:hypothetical protein